MNRRAYFDGYGVVTIATTKSNVSADQRAFAERMDAQLPFDLAITSGTRSPYAQAKAISNNRAAHGDAAQRALYRSQPELIGEVLAKSKTDVAGMARVLTAQIKRGRYLSRHMRADAIDLRTRDKSSAQVQQMIAVARSLGARPNLESDHLHVGGVSGTVGKVTAALKAAGAAGGAQAQVAYAARRVPWWAYAAGGTAFLLLIVSLRRRGRRAPPPRDYADY